MTLATAPVSSRESVRWARAAAAAALAVPAAGVERRVWAVRGLADTALGCLLLDAPETLAIVDEAVRDAAFGPAGAEAARLRRVRSLAGPVPPFYPADSAPAVRTRSTAPEVRAAVEALRQYCAALRDPRPRAPSAPRPTPRPNTRGRAGPAPPPPPQWGPAPPLASPAPAPPCSGLSVRGLVAWGGGLRPSACDHSAVGVSPAFPPGTAWRTWFRLPRGVVLVERPAVAPVRSRAVWRAVHDGAHLDHLAALPPAAPAHAEYGGGLLTAEAYAMAVEVLAAAEAAWSGRDGLVRELCDGLAERAARPAGGGAFGALPTLAAAYVLGPLRLLGGADRALPGRLGPDLRARWGRAVARVPAAAALDRRIGALC
ncbi:hypothetical protein [Actinomadura algeriensis]|uniref:Uncharacterized protein n=1 Tax=Actinomadura algeriensis TaxID=1679523 RepID=A0ABR9K2J8_9ACTN|nr:hypothetical protein [Actinomadura algeriensis]MBE1537047.1 hypothetical protein [Actinomadura algeriensis]